MRAHRKVRRLAIAAIAAACSAVQAADRFWVTGNGSFNATTSWSATEGGASGASVPGSADVANFAPATTYTVLGNPTTVQQVVVKASNVTLEMQGGTLTATTIIAAKIGTTTTDIGRLTLLDGTFNVGTLFNNVEIGTPQDSTGFMTVTTGGRITGQPDMVAGGLGTGTLTVQNGGRIDGGRAFIAESVSGVGTATVTGIGSSWTNTSDVYVGFAGFGTLNITGGGFVSSTSNTLIGENNTGVGTVFVSGTGSALSAGILVGADSGTATVSVRSGAQLTSINSEFGGSGGSQGTITVADSGSQWTDGGSSIGFNGNADVIIDNGGRWLSNNTVSVGINATSSGTVTVRGTNSLWSAAGAVTVASAGNGTLNVSSGAEVIIGGTLTIGDPAGVQIGRLNLDGGSITTTSFQRNGALNWSDGRITIKGGFFNNSSANLTINGLSADDLPTLELIGAASGTGFSGSTLTIGSSRQAALNINTNSFLTVGDLLVGSAGGNGIVTLASGGSLTANTNFDLGGSNSLGGGAGTLNINLGGTASASTTLRLWPGGAVNLNGGILNIQSLTTAGGHINFNSGDINFLSGAGLNDGLLDALLGQAHTLGAGQTLRTPSNYTLTSDITISGGALIAPGFVQTFSNITMTGGSLAAGEVDISSNAVMAMEGGVISAPNINIIGGEFQLHVGALVLPSVAFNNAGVLTGSGQITGVLFNNPTGSVRADAGQRLVITGSGGTNNGALEAIGGEVEFTHGWTNNATGTISGRNAMLRFGTGLTNSGTLGLSFGTSDVVGTISNNSGGKIIVSGNSQATFWNSISNNSGAELRISTGSTAVFFGPVTNSGTISGGGVKIFEGGGSGLGAVATAGSTVVESAASVSASFFRESALTVNGLVTINTSGGMSHLNSLTIDGSTNAWDGVLDLKNNSLVLEGGDLAIITNQIKSGLYSGTGITSSAPGNPFRLGSMSNAGTIYSSFQGIGGLDGNEVLIRYTRIGDLNLDGTVSIADFIDLAAHFNQSSATWQMGDVNYDGTVSIADFIDLASNFNQSVSGDAMPISDQEREMLASFAAANGASSVPEPGLFAGMTVGLILMGRRGRVRASVASFRQKL